MATIIKYRVKVACRRCVKMAKNIIKNKKIKLLPKRNFITIGSIQEKIAKAANILNTLLMFKLSPSYILKKSPDDKISKDCSCHLPWSSTKTLLTAFMY